jgi:high affinity Mn2+ porin
MVNTLLYDFIKRPVCDSEAETRLHLGGFLRLAWVLCGIWLIARAGAFGQTQPVASSNATLPDAPTPVMLASTLRDDSQSASPAAGQSNDPPAAPAAGDSSVKAPAVVPMTTMFPHSETWPIWISGQANFIFQTHPNFHSPYEGVNSFTAPFEYKVSMVGTLYTGLQVPGTHRLTEVLFDEESAGGRGLSQALGLAGFTNLDVVRNPNLGPVPYVAQWIVSQTIPLSSETVQLQRGPISLATEGAVRRLVFHIGKMGIPDFFDQNEVLSDSHQQFTNWTVDNNGAWDYAADTRGYTRGIAVEYFDRHWEARYGFFQMPTVANGIDLSWDFHQARGQNAEIEIDRGFIPHQLGKVRVLGFWNNANMGSYRQANEAYLDGQDPVPEITAHEHQDSLKYGIGMNVEQAITPQLRVSGRFGWNEGQHESWCYTEVDQTFLVGADYGQPLGASGGQDRDRVRLQRDFQRLLDVSQAGRPRLSSWRRNAQLRPRKHCRELLQPARLARTLLCAGVQRDRRSRVQPRPRAGLCAVGERARGFLKPKLILTLTDSRWAEIGSEAPDRLSG